MDKNELLERLKLFGVSLYSDETVSDEALKIDVSPEINGNQGFYHLKSDSFTAIILKGVYKDFYRILTGKKTLSEDQFAEIAKALNEAEQALEKQFKAEIYFAGNTAYIKDIECVQLKKSSAIDNRNITIPRPLTSSEYLAPVDSFLDDNTILSASFLNNLFPDTVSMLTLDIFRKQSTDLLNPFFTSFNIKTGSPSTVLLYDRPYINLTAFESTLEHIGIGCNLFRANYSTSVYLKNKLSDGVLRRGIMPDSYNEIVELLTELERKTGHLDIPSLISDDFDNYPIWMMIVYEYLMIELANSYSELNILTKHSKNLLKLIYRTRKTNIFKTLESKRKLPLFFDFASEIIDTQFSKNSFTLSDVDTLMKKLSINSKLMAKSKIEKAIKNIHRLLDLRDELYLKSSDFIVKINSLLLSFGETMQKKEKILNKEDIFYFDREEIKRLYNDTYFGEIRNTILLRRSQKERFASQLLPNEIFYKDLGNILSITETMYSKLMEKDSFETLSLFSKELEADAVKDSTLTDYSDKIFATSKLPLSMLERLKNAKAIVIDSNSVFSYLTEFAAVYDIPVHAGINFAGIILDGKKLKLKNNLVSVLK